MKSSTREYIDREDLGKHTVEIRLYDVTGKEIVTPILIQTVPLGSYKTSLYLEK